MHRSSFNGLHASVLDTEGRPEVFDCGLLDTSLAQPLLPSLGIGICGEVAQTQMTRQRQTADLRNSNGLTTLDM